MKLLSVLLLTLFLSGCAGIRYGNFTNVPADKEAYLAKDSVSQLTRIYPPARQIFCICQKVRDPFGVRLIEEMRQKGYGVVENVHPGHKANFFYVVDELDIGHLYRVSLYVGQETLSRLYAKNRGKLTPISPWSHKE